MASPEIATNATRDGNVPTTLSEDSVPTPATAGSYHPGSAGIILWAFLSLGSLAFILFGSITTKSWKLDVFQQAWMMDTSPRKILHVWSYQLDHLATGSAGELVRIAFGASLFILVVGTVVGLWMILVEASPVGKKAADGSVVAGPADGEGS